MAVARQLRTWEYQEPLRISLTVLPRTDDARPPGSREPPTMMTNLSLCEQCRWLREVISGKGSRFLMCQLARTDPRFAKYPPQPVRDCAGFVPEAVLPPEADR